jgi:chemotaxis protein methyltransferase WspC
MRVRALLREATGLDLNEATVTRAVKRRMLALGLARRADYDALLGAGELAALIEEVVVPESWMFRDAEAFAVATAFLQERLLRTRSVRMLSIPCAGGEEP